ncbi:unnamed protein product [Meganyctiphanes norvegica]|uniref:Integrase catalytic domain-containing protein n=1 Tax=Meganyctiphanes norvegica TaxID=48144 RepID=A0AAV2RQL8_MEGNR
MNKYPSTIIAAFFRIWITIFGAPRKILSDNGGEFNNVEMRALGESFNFTVLTTAAESPWSNGIVERLNGILGVSVGKIMLSAKCDLNVALAWAVAARNANDNKDGFSPNQLVFSFNPAIPSATNSRLPGLEEVTSSEVVMKNLIALHKARESFILAGNDERLKRALRANVRHSIDVDLETGDRVYYKRNNEDRWKGPGEISGIIGKQIRIEHGGSSVQVHSTRIQKAPDDKDCDINAIQTGECNSNPSQNIQSKCSKLSATLDPNTDVTSNMSDSTPETMNVYGRPIPTYVDSRPKVRDVDQGRGNLDRNPDAMNLETLQSLGGNSPRKRMHLDDNPNVRGVDQGQGNLDRNPDAMNLETLQSLGGNSPRKRMHLDDSPSVVDDGPLQALDCLGKTKRVLEEGSIEKQSIKCRKTEGKTSKVIPKTWRKGQRFQGVDKNTGNFVSGSIVSRAGKATGGNKNCYNVILDSSGMHGWFNMDTLKDIEVSGEEENVILYVTEEVQRAKEKEIESWVDNDVFQKVRNKGQKSISVRWVVTTKQNTVQGNIIKARLVARGFEEDKSILQTDSPTCSRESVRLLITLH